MGTDHTYFSGLPLWTPRYDSTPSMDFFSPYGGWDRPYIKQFSGGATNLRRIGCSRVNVNYIESFINMNSTIIEAISF